MVPLFLSQPLHLFVGLGDLLLDWSGCQVVPNFSQAGPERESITGLVKNGQDKRIPEPLPRGTSLRASVYLLRVVFLSSSWLKS